MEQSCVPRQFYSKAPTLNYRLYLEVDPAYEFLKKKKAWGVGHCYLYFHKERNLEKDLVIFTMMMNYQELLECYVRNVMSSTIKKNCLRHQYKKTVFNTELKIK